MLRFSASPTGDMLISELRMAIMSYLLAQQGQKSFVVRIDDTNKAENIEGKDTEIMQILEKFALTHTSVFHQSEHLHMHQTLAIKLLEEDKAFICTCLHTYTTDAPCDGHCSHVDKTQHTTLKASGEPFVIRIKPSEPSSADEIDAFIILNADNTPSGIFASACDDMLTDISTVILEETKEIEIKKHIHIKAQLGFNNNHIYHLLPSLSHSLPNFTVKWLLEEGFIPDAIINYLVQLSLKEIPQEVFLLPNAIPWTVIENLTQETQQFELDRLKTINREHLKRIDDTQLSTLFGFADADIGKLAKLYLKDLSTVNELKEKILPIFNAKAFNTPWEKEMRIIEALIQNAPMFSHYNDFESYLMTKSNLKDEAFFIPLRLLLTNTSQGPELSEIYPFINAYLLEVAS